MFVPQKGRGAAFSAVPLFERTGAMEEKKNLMTKEGLQKLEAELEDLKVNKMKEIAKKIGEAREQGDLSENAEYDAAKDEQGKIKGRIDEIEEILKHVELVDDSDMAHINLGYTVKLLDVELDEEETFDLVGSNEIDSLHGKISNESPVGKAVIGHKIGDTVTVDTEAGSFQYKILDAKRTPV